MKRLWLIPLIGFALWPGCHGPDVKHSDVVAEPPRIVSLELRTATTTEAGWQSVMPGSTLTTGTDFSLNVSVGQAAYVYIAQRSGNAAVSVVYPLSTTKEYPVASGQAILVPAAGQWFKLDNHAGEETLFALVSTRQLQLQSAQQLLSERGDAACVKSRDPPPPEVKVRDRGAAVHGLMGSDGIAVLCFPFHHR